MSEQEAPAAVSPEAPEKPAGVPKPSAAGGIIKVFLSAIFAAGAAYGGARAAAAHGSHAPSAESAHKVEAHPPGPTVALDPFLVTVVDVNKKGHAMKITLAVEFEATQKEDALKPFAPRIRDAILSHVRGLTYEDAADGAHVEKLRTELLERCHKAGATGAQRVLITDFVIQ